jgi:putative ABC transport system permease protein
MSIFQSVRVAMGALGANKLRTVLTMLGMIIGVCAVISLMSIGQGAQAQVTNQIRGMGTNLLFIRPGSTQTSGVRSAQGRPPTIATRLLVRLRRSWRPRPSRTAAVS